MDVSILIVNYQTAHCIQTCIASCLQQKNLEFEIIVVENASTDESKTLLKNYGSKIKLIDNLDNLGFAKACNQAAKIAYGKYLYLLNPDAAFLDATSLMTMLAYHQTHPEVGLLGSKLIDDTNRQQILWDTQGYPGQKQSKFVFRNLPGVITHIACASVMIKKTFFEELQGFDERFFVYGEDIDLSLRVRQHGYTIDICEKVSVKHRGGGSEQQSTSYAKHLRRQQSVHQFMQKHYPKKIFTKILRANLRRARKQIWFLKLFLLFKNREKFKHKLNRYQAMQDVCLHWAK